MLDLHLIRIDGGTQSRVELNQDTVAEYAEGYKAGADMPPVIVYYDGADRWLADGFHRYFGAKAAGLTQIYENIIPGTLRDAVLYSLQANAKHGLKRTNADKRRAVETLLADAEWSQWSDAQIAKAAAVSDKTVAAHRVAIFGNSEDTAPTRTVERNGKTYTQNVSNIGKAKPARHHGNPKKGPTADLIRAELKAAGNKHAAETALGHVAELEQRVTALSEQLAGVMTANVELQADYASVVKILDAGDQLAAALQEAKTARDLSRVLQERINSMMTQISELQRSVKAWKKKAEATA